jgi:hypothetical protein
MKKTFVVAILTAALAACGGKAKQNTTPKTDDKTGATGGATYGGGSGAAPTPNKPPADPCSGGGPM